MYSSWPTLYDAFMLEDDGRVEEKIYNEYMELGPVIRRHSRRWVRLLKPKRFETTNIDLVICMPGNADNDAFTVARAIKGEFPDIHCIVLTPFSHGITKRMQDEDLSIFDYVFCWLGTNLIPSIIKLIEDKMNLDHDIREAGVQMILLVEDSIRFYSSILPNLYSYLLVQSQRFSTEALNRHSATLRMRGRPKVVLARTYEEAMELYDKYADNTLVWLAMYGLPVGGEKDPAQGLKLLRTIRAHTMNMCRWLWKAASLPNRKEAEGWRFPLCGQEFKTMNIDLRHIMEEHMGFWRFHFPWPQNASGERVHNLKELQDNIFKILTIRCCIMWAENHMSRWF